METWLIPVPGTFTPGVAYLDLETVKVPCDYVMANGETLKRRWGIAWAGVGLDGAIRLMAPETIDEPIFLGTLGDSLTGNKAVVYGATREFDEMICRGRFTTARRAHAPEPFFPAAPGADNLPWKNVGAKAKSEAPRGVDCESRDVPALLGYAPVGGGRKMPKDGERVMVHLLRDVADLILVAGATSIRATNWCERVLADYDFAWGEIFGGEDA
jgi:hypothetical protein